MDKIDDLAKTLPANPRDPGLKPVKEFADDFGASVTNGTIGLDDLLRHRLDLRRSLRKATELKALYGGIVQDLEGAARRGVPEPSPRPRPLTCSRRVRACRCSRTSSTSRVSSRGRPDQDPLRPLNIKALEREVLKNADEIKSLLGDSGLNIVKAYIDRFRSLPPTTAYSGWNTMRGLMSSALALAAGRWLVVAPVPRPAR